MPIQQSTFRAMLALALPVLAEEALNLLVGYTDWFLAGRFLPGQEPRAAMGLVAYLLWLLPSLFSVVGIGALAVVARLVGEGNRKEAAHVARQSLIVGCFAAVGGVTLALLAGGSFVRAMQLEGKTAELATRYIWIMAPGIPFVMLEQVGTACLRGAGDTMTGLVARGFVNLIDATVSTLLVAGASSLASWGWQIGPLSTPGWDGLAIGTLCGHIVGGSIILYRLVRGGGGLSLAISFPGSRLVTHYREGPPSPGSTPQGNEAGASGYCGPRQEPGTKLLAVDWATIKRILRIGIPGGFDVWLVLACHLTYAAIINSLGTLAQAAHGLGLEIEAMSYLPGSAFSVAAATLAGQSLGAADQQRAVRGVLHCAVSAVAIMSVAGVVMYVAGESIATFFTGERDQTALLAGRLLRIVAISCPFLAILSVLIGALRGAGDTRVTLVITIVGLVGVRLPGACLLAWPQVSVPFTDFAIPAAGLGVAGAWWAMVSDVALRAVLAAVRFGHGGWKKVRV